MFRSFSLALFLSLVNAKSFLDNVKYLTGGEKQLKYLAESVCNDLEFMLESKISQAACQRNFMSSVKWSDSKESQSVSVRCRSERTLQILAQPSDSWQLLVLVPETEDNRDFSYSLVEPNTNFSEVSVAVPSRNHVLFSTVLSHHVRPGHWRGVKVPAWKVERRQYDVQVTFTNYSSTYDGTVDGVVTWNHTGDSDLCFEVFNICSQSGIKTKQTWPGNKQRVIIDRLHLDDQCEVSVKGLYGTTNLQYHTPAHDSLHQDIVPGSRHLPEGSLPEIPSDLSVIAREDGAGDDAWTVRVGWAKPRVTPDKYNVTLRANVVTTIEAPANATEAIFTGVTGEGVYNVSVLAIKGRYKAHNFARAAFPGRAPAEWVWAGAGGAGGAAALLLLALVLCYVKLRNKIFTKRKPKNRDTKPLDEDLEALATESCEDQWEIKSERLALHEVIGEGAFGVVRRGTLAPMGKEVAVKMLKDFPSLDEVRAFRLEMELMKSVGAHPHVVSLLGCCSGKRPLIVAQYCARGDLLSFLRRSWDVMVSKRNAQYYNNNDTSYRNDLFKCKIQHHTSLVVNKMYDIESLNECELTSLDLLSFCRQIAMGMEFLANNRLVHRDLAARNVLVTGDRTLKIADFGLSRDVYEENQYKQKGNGKMPVKWMAPESLTRRIYTSQSDVWSFGVVVWEVATVGGAPYPDVPAARLPRLLRAGYRMPRPLNCSPALYDLMLECWAAAPRARPTFAALHARLDELLNCACAHHYLCLEIDAPPAPRLHAYRRILLRGKRAFKRETYERPLKAIQGNHNHYSSPPVTLAKAPA